MTKNSNSNQQPIEYKHMKVKLFTVLSTALGILLYFADIFSDLYLAIKYYHNGHIGYFSMTLSLFLFSSIISSLFSLYMYYIDDKEEKIKASGIVWKLRAIFLILGIAPVWRSCVALHFAWKSYYSKEKTKKHEYARRTIFEITDVAFLRLFEAFLESGPQFVLQLYIFAQTQSSYQNIFAETEKRQCISMIISAVSMSISIVAYLNSLRNSLDYKNELKVYMLVLLFLCRFFEVTSRVIAMGLAISVSLYFLVAFVVHFVVVVVWIWSMKTNFCNDWYAERVYNALLGMILIFVYFNPEDSPTRKRCIQFYLCVFLENTAMMVFWFYYCSPALSFKLPAMVTQNLSFIFSIILMVIYYKYFHPTVGELTKKKTPENIILKNVSENVIGNNEENAMLGNNKVSEDLKEKEEITENCKDVNKM